MRMSKSIYKLIIPFLIIHISVISFAGVNELSDYYLSLIHISEPTRLLSISYAVFCLKKKGVKIIGINFRDDEENFKKWINDHGNPFEYILRDDGTIAYEMGLIGVPETFFIVNKTIQKKIQGPLFYEDVEKYL